jgi:hypothetical protein
MDMVRLSPPRRLSDFVDLAFVTLNTGRMQLMSSQSNRREFV